MAETPSLFAEPRRRERRTRTTEKATRAVISHWQETGHILDELAIALLIGAARTVDEAEYDHKHGKTAALSVQRCRDSLAARYVEFRPVTNTRQAPDAFFTALRDRVEASSKKEAFVFVHGFNTTFDEAAYRTAQLAHDLKFEGAPIFYSWPSQGGLLEYAIDETNVVWTVPHLKEFLVGVARHSGANAVHLVAHSMGNRALTSALQLLSYELRDEPAMFREVVLTAPDIDAEVFRRDVVPAIVTTADRVTLYASSNDEALKLSKAIHGYRRAGDSGGQDRGPGSR